MDRATLSSGLNNPARCAWNAPATAGNKPAGPGELNVAITRRTLMLASAGTFGHALRGPRGRSDQIGMTVPMTGPAAESGGFQQTGVKLALEMVNEKGVLGRPMTVTFEDDQTTNPRRGARLLPPVRRPGDGRLPRLDPLHPGDGDGARRAEDQQADDDRRHRPGTHPYGQPLAVPLPAERQLLRQGDLAIRHETHWRRRNGRSSTRPTRSAPAA